MTKLLKYVGIYLIIMSIMTLIALEMNFEITTYLLLYVVIGSGLFSFFKYFKFYGLKPNIVLLVISTSLFPTYLLTASVIMYETDLAYSKIKSISNENLKDFYNTNNINTIPKEKRHTWIGARYRKINVISEDNIKAVGWRGHSVFAYYDLDKDDYSGSYH